jgi:hypothetical protein
MISELKKNIEQKMQKSVEALKTDLAKVRTGRAHTGLLDHVMVEYYGSMVPVNQVANITLIDARTIGVQTWEKPMLGKVERAIRDSDLGLNPANMGELLRVPMPALTEERRRDAVDAPPRDPATAALLDALAEQRDRACACTDAACADDAAALAVQWGLDHPDIVRAATPSPADQAAIAALLDAAEHCLDLGTGSTHPPH